MLTELHIKNFAIIQDLTLQFQKGLVIFTGETGAGKSIILDALEAVLGGRVDITAIRTGAERAFVEAEFQLEEPVKSKVKDMLAKDDLVEEPDFLVLTREIRSEGRNIARINGHSVSTGLQRELGSLLVDIHGQSEHLSLLKEHNHLDLLDRFANTGPLLQEYGLVYKEFRSVQKQLEALRQAEIDSARRTDMLAYQIREIEVAKLFPGEEDELRQERTRLSNAESLSSLSQQALVLLDEGTPENGSISDMLGEVLHALSELNRIDRSTHKLFEHAETSLSTLSDLAMDLRSYAEAIEFNPRRLDQIEERIDLLNSLKRKYGNTIEEILEYAEHARVELDNIAHSEERINELEENKTHLMEVTSKKASELSIKRSQATRELSGQIEAQLEELNMNKARFAVDMRVEHDENGILLPDGRKVAFDARGIDKVAFLVEPNPGEGLKPLVKIASGGETSRLMLALKNVLAAADTIPVLIFDEIDQGVGGRVGMVVGEKLWNLSTSHQVMCVTHLPQLAAFGDQHYHVNKHIEDGRTLTGVEQLEGDMRQLELAQMLGPVTEGTLRSAEEILAIVSEKKRYN
jgi:DNA repair protein RecN (Recombination protein N)